MSAILDNAVKNINALYDVVGEIQGRLRKLEDEQNANPIKSPNLNLVIDTPILVRDYEDDDWDRRYFKCWDDGSCVCFNNGGTSWSSVGSAFWRYWKLPEENN